MTALKLFAADPEFEANFGEGIQVDLACGEGEDDLFFSLDVIAIEFAEFRGN